MPNRIIKESVRYSETINELSAEEEVFFYRLLTACDDYGCFYGRPDIIRAALYPLRLDSVSAADVDRMLGRLQQVGLVLLYNVDGKYYLKIVTWEHHQQIRAKRHKYPEPPASICSQPRATTTECEYDVDSLQSSDINCYHVQSNDCNSHRNPIQSNPNPNPNPNSSSAADAPTPLICSDADEDLSEEETNLRPHRRSESSFSEDSTEFQLAALLREKILANNPNARVPAPSPGQLVRWCREFDLMLRVDKRAPPEIRAVIDWCQTDSFWRANILSPRKLREKFDTLWLQMQRKPEVKRDGAVGDPRRDKLKQIYAGAARYAVKLPEVRET